MSEEELRLLSALCKKLLEEWDEVWRPIHHAEVDRDEIQSLIFHLEMLQEARDACDSMQTPVCVSESIG